MQNSPIDKLDLRILAELRRDGRISNTELALKVGLSESACLRRVRQLESSGLIERYMARLNLFSCDRDRAGTACRSAP
ncbi:MAG: winged helix-turn-helix transcriptional regulator [Gammaproteobacteria bacterium]|nr:winged helix-turn-helix transcriptional regulator [Gammaproteobacteria bacterium]